MKRLICLTYIAVLIVLGTATFLENAHGFDWVHRYVYGSWWFMTLWWILAVSGICYFLREHVRRKSIVAVHLALLMILAGAFVSHLTGRSGTIHLRKDHPQCLVNIQHSGRNYLHKLDYDVTLRKFDIVTDSKGNPIDYISEFVINGKLAKVSMNRIYRYANLRLYQSSYDDDLQGSTLIVNRDPYGIPITYAGYLLLFGSLIYICIKRWVSWKVWLVGIGFTSVWCVYYFLLDGSWMNIPVLRSPLLFVHVVTIIMAYMLLLVQAIVSVLWLIRHDLPEMLHVNINGLAVLRLSVCFLALGIFLGAIWANISWGNYWSWDSKEVWALITFMIYAIPLHQVSLPIFRRQKVYHRFMAVAFLVVVMTYYGVNYCLVGMHSYA